MTVELTALFHVHERNEDGSLGNYIGGADDPAAAALIACSTWMAMQEYATKTGRIHVVVDDTGKTVSWIGKNPQQAGTP